MRDIEKQIYSCLEQPLPPDVLQCLLEVIETAGILKGVMMCSHHADLIRELILLWDLLFEAAAKDIYMTYADATLDIYSQNQDSFMYKQFDAIQACRGYADSKLALFGMLPATDIIKINECIVHQNKKLILETIPADAYNEFSNSINSFMSSVYSSPHHPYIRAAVVIFCSKEIISHYQLHSESLEILCTSLFYPTDILTLQLAKYQMLHRINASWGFSINDFLINFLLYTKNELSNIIVLIRSLEIGRNELVSTLKDTRCLKHFDLLVVLLQNHLCLGNETLARTLKISAKTSTEYMKELELCGLVAGHKRGRNKLYINNYLKRIVLEAFSNGS